jgi:radical SAM superfamily enzyme YgiQ (UPF0313 family)
MNEAKLLPILLKEYNSQIKNQEKVDMLFGFCNPSTYRAGMTNLSTHLFYTILNSRSDTSCERYFRYDTPSAVHSIESSRPLCDNHIIGFSLNYEENIIALVQTLEKGGIPILASERGYDDPIVLVGGPVASANPEPYTDFVDVFVIGEGDLVIHDIVDIVTTSESRVNAIHRLAEVEGVYVPVIGTQSVNRLIIPDLDALQYPVAQIIPDVPDDSKLEPVFGKSFLLEVSRGCEHSCKFCLIGHICRPRRVRSLNCLKRLVENGIEQTPVSKISLIASSLGEKDAIEDLVGWIVEQGLQLSVPSLRADSVTEELLKSLVKGGQRTLTIAPETGSSDLRTRLGKGLSDTAIYNSTDMAVKAGVKALKLYFVIGLPDETLDDVSEISRMTQKIAQETGLRVTASVNPFVPKAHTRWERNPQNPIEIIRKKMKIIEKELRNVPHVTLETLDPRIARIQAALSIGDRSLGKVIRKAAEYGGLGGWRRAEKETKTPFFSIANDADRLQGNLPWSFIS